MITSILSRTEKPAHRHLGTKKAGTWAARTLEEALQNQVFEWDRIPSCLSCAVPELRSSCLGVYIRGGREEQAGHRVRKLAPCRVSFWCLEEYTATLSEGAKRRQTLPGVPPSSALAEGSDWQPNAGTLLRTVLGGRDSVRELNEICLSLPPKARL